MFHHNKGMGNNGITTASWCHDRDEYIKEMENQIVLWYKWYYSHGTPGKGAHTMTPSTSSIFTNKSSVWIPFPHKIVYNCIAVRNKSCIWNTKHVYPLHFCLILSITFMLQRWGYTVYCRVGPNMAHNRTMLSVLAGDEAREAYGKIQVYIYHIKAKSSTWCCINLTGQIYKLWVTIS